MCYIGRRKDMPMMSSEQITEFIDTLADFTEGKVDINFIGGEPLLRKDIFNLISAATKHGLRTTLCTNGYLVDYAMAKRLSESGLKGLAISLDSLNEQTHDTLRGMEGSFKRIMQALEHLSCFTSEEFRVNIQTVISRQNLTGLVELAKWVQKSDKVCGVYFMAVVQPLHTEEIDNWQTMEPYKELWPQDIKETNAVIDELIRLKSAEKYQRIINSVGQLKAFKSYFEDPYKFLKRISCNLGEYALNVDYSGDFSPCFTMGVIGNICTGDIRQMWGSEKAIQVRQKMKQCKKNCNFLINCYQEETVDEAKLSI
jgi:MoaA/NifB/PqqE/SkfB family radical SAM enzyme